MPFATDSDAKQFLIDRISVRAAAVGQPLSDHERRMLLLSESSPDASLEAEQILNPDDFGVEFEDRMSEMLKSAYELDAATSARQGQLYWEALAALSRGDHYIGFLAELAGLRRPLPPWLEAIKQVVLFLVLFVPALVALLIAGAGLWAAWRQASRSAAESAGMGVVALIFVGFAAFLLALWFRERRKSGHAAEQGVAADER